MDFDKLKQVICKYIPLGNDDRYSEEYYETTEIRNLELLSANFKNNNHDWIVFKNLIKNQIPSMVFHDVSFKYDNFLTRCYSLVADIGVNNGKEIIIDLNVSFIAPFYTISLLEFDITGKNEWKHPPDVTFNFASFNIENEVNNIKNVINDIFKYSEFPKDKLGEVIPGIAFEGLENGKFTYFNALFCNRYQIRF